MWSLSGMLVMGYVPWFVISFVVLFTFCSLPCRSIGTVVFIQLPGDPVHVSVLALPWLGESQLTRVFRGLLSMATTEAIPACSLYPM